MIVDIWLTHVHTHTLFPLYSYDPMKSNVSSYKPIKIKFFNIFITLHVPCKYYAKQIPNT